MSIRFSLICLAIVFISCPSAWALRYDLSGVTGRRDAETLGWQEWEIGGEPRVSRSTDGITVSIRGVQGDIEGYLHKPGLATGATLASDGVRSEGSIEIEIEGLEPGPHSIATWHNVSGGDSSAPLMIQIGDKKESIEPTHDAADDFDAATAHVEFVAPTDGTVKVVLTSVSGPVVLNAMEIDADSPALRPVKPTPAHGNGHVQPTAGRVALSWRPSPGASEYLVFHATGATREEATGRLSLMSAATHTTSEPTHTLNVEPNDSLTYHAWYVRAAGSDGSHQVGDTWIFRQASLAFPGAEGYGRFSRGGRGGRVLHVTNLDDAGPGSLRAAVEAEGPRTVVFDISGRIQLEKRLVIRNGQLTIAGQTAPGKGICVSNYNLGALGAEDLILRYLRVRPGDTSGKTLDGMGLASCDHSIIDHCSISWSHDEAFSSRGAQNITLQRTLISEALNIAGHKKYGDGKAHGFAASIGGDIGSFHHNLLAHCAGRNWSLAGGLDQANRHRGRLDIRNNVVFNWDYRTTDGGAAQVQFVNNYYKPGPATRVFHVLKPEREGVPPYGPQDYYVIGNVMEGKYGPRDRYAGVIEPREEPLSAFIYEEPFYPHFVGTQSAKGAYRSVLSDVGCNVPQLDQHDQRVIQETRRGETTYAGSVSGKPGLPDSQEDVGGWEDYPVVRRPEDWDPDGDGMPSKWEELHGLDPSDPGDGPVDLDGDGYTNLEDYLNSLVR